MRKNSTRYVCQGCGSAHPKWLGKCEACGAWNSLVEEQAVVGPPKSIAGSKGKGKGLAFSALQGGEKPPPRILSHIGEFDRVTGGGLVPGSVLLIGGDPGIGKSTLLLQVVAQLAPQIKCAYVSGEEAMDQVRLRAERLGLANAPVQLAASTDIRSIVASMEDRTDAPQLIVIDSIQTMYVDVLDSAPGTVAQVRASAHELIRAAKKNNITVLIVGHVTKEGTLAGPRVLEHMVDTVLYFEGERGHPFRILRAVKNRFGPTDEIGVFDMQEKGLVEVTNPSALFLSERQGDISGAAVFAGIEGTRPLLVEIQALVAPSSLGTPRRAVIGWDSGRLAMILAVLEARAGVTIGMNDVYLNVAGGLKITEPAADLAVAAALLSSLSGTPVPREAVFFGEIGLSGEIRSVGQPSPRLKEAAKLGFERAFSPSNSHAGMQVSSGMKLTGIKTVADLVPYFELESGKKRASRP